MLLRVACLLAIVAASACAEAPSEIVDGCPAGVIEGVLVVIEHGTAIQAGAERTPIRWPEGYRLHSGLGRTTIQNERGNPVARVGSIIRLSGGLTDDGEEWITCGPPLGTP